MKDKITRSLGLIDDVIPEPLGGAHRDGYQVAANLKKSLLEYLNRLTKTPMDALIENRHARLRSYGRFNG